MSSSFAFIFFTVSDCVFSAAALLPCFPESLTSSNKMLTATDVEHCLRVRSILCSLKLFPLKVDLAQGRFLRLVSKFDFGLCMLLFAHYMLRTAFVNYGMCRAILHSEYSKEDVHLLTWDMMAFFASNLFAAWYWILFFRKPDITVCILNQSFARPDCNTG